MLSYRSATTRQECTHPAMRLLNRSPHVLCLLRECAIVMAAAFLTTTATSAMHLPPRTAAEDGGGPTERHPNRTERPTVPLYFVYSQAPDHMVLPARRNGEIERVSFANSLRNVRNSDERRRKHFRLEMYAKHFAQCAFASRPRSEESVVSPAVADDYAFDDDDDDEDGDGSPTIKKTIFDNKVDKFLPAAGPVRALTNALGVDPASTRFFEMSPAHLVHTIQKSCLKNELKFQCAYGFLDDVDKIHEHIRFMKMNDGNFKVMLEKECKNAEDATLPTRTANTDGAVPPPDLSYFDASRSVYSCIHRNAATVLGQCRETIKAYNETRRDVNAKMEQIFDETIATIEKHADAAIENNDSTTLKRILRKGGRFRERLIERTLVELSRLEAHKCRRYAMAERCALEAVAVNCSADAADSFTTLLRVGYLQRERGYALHQQFVEARVPAHRACRRFFRDDVVADAAAADEHNHSGNNEHQDEASVEGVGSIDSILDVSDSGDLSRET